MDKTASGVDRLALEKELAENMTKEMMLRSGASDDIGVSLQVFSKLERDFFA